MRSRWEPITLVISRHALYFLLMGFLSVLVVHAKKEHIFALVFRCNPLLFDGNFLLQYFSRNCRRSVHEFLAKIATRMDLSQERYCPSYFENLFAIFWALRSTHNSSRRQTRSRYPTKMTAISRERGTLFLLDRLTKFVLWFPAIWAWREGSSYVWYHSQAMSLEVSNWTNLLRLSRAAFWTFLPLVSKLVSKYWQMQARKLPLISGLELM